MTKLIVVLMISQPNFVSKTFWSDIYLNLLEELVLKERSFCVSGYSGSIQIDTTYPRFCDIENFQPLDLGQHLTHTYINIYIYIMFFHFGFR